MQHGQPLCPEPARGKWVEGQRASGGKAPSPPPCLHLQEPSLPRAGRRARPPFSPVPSHIAQLTWVPGKGQRSWVLGRFEGLDTLQWCNWFLRGLGDEGDRWSIGEARKGYTEGAGPSCSGRATPLPPLTLASAPLSLSLLRMCRKAFSSPKPRLHPAVGRMRHTRVPERGPFLASELKPSRLRTRALVWVRACAAGTSPCARAAEGRGRRGRKTPGSAGAGRGQRAQPANGGRPTSAGATPPPASATEEEGKGRGRGLGTANPLGRSEKAGKSGSKRSPRWRRGPGWGGWAKGRAGPQVTRAGPQSGGDLCQAVSSRPAPPHPRLTSLKGRPRFPSR